MRRSAKVETLILLGLLLAAPGAKAQESTSPGSVVRQSRDDAWWTGPMLAPSAGTLPRGHFLIEPYFYDVIAAHSRGYGSLTYALYGLAEKFTVGVIPTVGYNTVSDGLNGTGIRMGDISLQGQYRLHLFHEGGWIPTTSVALQETLPTGKYDRLGERPSDGLGSGALTTTLALYSQTYFWLPNGRILRTRFNVSESISREVTVQDVSVYGTQAGFRGHAQPGSALLVDLSGEYSLTRRWVLALDATCRYQGNTAVSGYNSPDPAQPSVHLDSGSSAPIGFAPAIEYSWKPNLGVLIGVRIIAAGRNTPTTITPALAINFVH
jgi:hypothetical protein